MMNGDSRKSRHSSVYPLQVHSIHTSIEKVAMLGIFYGNFDKK